VSGWWPTKIRQFGRHLFGWVARTERDALAHWLSAPQLALFDSMHRADQRHGLDVVRSLRAASQTDPDVLLAGLLHDCGKGQAVGVWHRVGWSLADHYGPRVRRIVNRLPGFPAALANLDSHAEKSAELAMAAGCSARCADLIRNQDEPVDDPGGVALRLADEAN
jgi:hypothetical protein